MLKNKLKALVTTENLGEQINFQVIHDSAASQITGGNNLPACGLYIGICPGLAVCGTYLGVK